MFYLIAKAQKKILKFRLTKNTIATTNKYSLCCKYHEIFSRIQNFFRNNIPNEFWTNQYEHKGYNFEVVSDITIVIIQRLKNKLLQKIIDTLWYVSFDLTHIDLNIKFIKDKITNKYTTYRVKLKRHPNKILTEVLDCRYNDTR